MQPGACVIVSAVRTAIGTFGGTLKDTPSTDLGATVVGAAIARCGVAAAEVDEVLMGQVYTAGVGPNPARLAALAAGLPVEVPATTVNKLCGSGLKAIALGAQAIAAGAAQIVVAGGMESMSRVPYLAQNARWGARLGHAPLVDDLLCDGLWDPRCDCHMADTAEHLAEQYAVTRQEQDRFAAQSQQRCQRAREAGLFAAEIAPIAVPQRKGPPLEFAADEHPRNGVTADSLAKLAPAFRPDGTVTAGNASGINDGAAAVVLTSAAEAAARGLTPLAIVRHCVSVGVEPRRMGIGPALAIRKLLARAEMSLDKLDLIEVNEAFAAQTLAVGKELAWDESRVNVNGGALALGHPLGASGARVAVSLLYEMQRRGCRFGIAALCIGGGMGIAMLLESL